MKKKLIKILAVIVLILLLFPFNIQFLKDGGSKCFRSLTYEIIKIHRLTDVEGSEGDTYVDGLIIKVLGFDVYNSFKNN